MQTRFIHGIALCIVTLALASCGTVGPSVRSTVCEKEDFEQFVSSSIGCIGIESASERPSLNKSRLVVYLHGDWRKPRVGYSLLKAAKETQNIEVNSFLMARPGWETPSGNRSDGGDPEGVDRGDNYIPERDIDPIADAISNLKRHYQPEQLILVGHSGGSAVAGVIIGRHPGLADIAVLGACPCVVPPWRESRMKQKRNISPSGKKWWVNSHSPHDYAADISKHTRVFLVIGSNDTNTFPKFSEAYIALLKEQNIESEIIYIDGAKHSAYKKDARYLELLTKIQRERL